MGSEARARTLPGTTRVNAGAVPLVTCLLAIGCGREEAGPPGDGGRDALGAEQPARDGGGGPSDDLPTETSHEGGGGSGRPGDGAMAADGGTSADGGPRRDDGPPSDGNATGDGAAEVPRAGPQVDTTQPKLHEHVVKPKDADPGADAWLADQVAYLDTRVPLAGKLAVYLVGAGGVPTGGRAMAQELATMGFHVVVPAYANDYGIGTGCAAADAECKGKKRLEAFEGTDASPLIDVKPPNSIEVRVARMLALIQTRHPGGDWAYFLDGAGPRWVQTVVAGHSHGASTAALVGKIRTVDRAVALSGPYDNTNGTPDAWARWASKTPMDRFYAFSHTGEPQHGGHVAFWRALQLEAFGPVVNVDSATPPFSGTHQLVTTVATSDQHGATTAGGSSPKLADGTYRLGPVWRTMLGR